jgi:DUF4097 and DUF4098 domain-containing protein YvlB
MKAKISLCALFLILAPFLQAHDEFKDLSLDATGIKNLDISCGAGFCKVYGQKGLNKINMEAEIMIKGLSSEKAQKYIEKEVVLSLEKRGSTAYLVSKFRPHSPFFSYRERVINLTVYIPYEMNLDVDDGSGSLLIENIQGRLKLNDGSGETRIQKITGDVNITDGSGEMQIFDVQGNLDIHDGSGNIVVTGIQGDLIVEDGSGNFKGVDIKGVVDIEDGSGNIRIKDALGDVRVDDGSGSIVINGVEKDVIIKEEGSGGLDISNVRGEVKK